LCEAGNSAYGIASCVALLYCWKYIQHNKEKFTQTLPAPIVHLSGFYLKVIEHKTHRALRKEPQRNPS
jgi:hypothetical protein